MAKSRSKSKLIEIKNIKAANAAYYQALSARDLHAMEKVWTCASDNMLIAPPSNPHAHVGWAAIKRNWQTYWPVFDDYLVSMRGEKGEYQRPGRLGAWHRDVKAAEEIGRSVRRPELWNEHFCLS